jgi:membrane protein required for colicin V production
VGGLIARLVGRIIKHTGLSGVNRILGSLFGLGRGAIVVGLMVIVLELVGLDEDPWWQEAKLRPYSARIADGILYYGAMGSGYIQEQDLV